MLCEPVWLSCPSSPPAHTHTKEVSACLRVHPPQWLHSTRPVRSPCNPAAAAPRAPSPCPPWRCSPGQAGAAVTCVPCGTAHTPIQPSPPLRQPSYVPPSQCVRPTTRARSSALRRVRAHHTRQCWCWCGAVPVDSELAMGEVTSRMACEMALMSTVEFLQARIGWWQLVRWK